jgi:hemoglobin
MRQAGGVPVGRTLYERVGGEPFFDELTRRFYQAVAGDEILRPMYPSDPGGFEAARVHLRDFLIQRWGGPTTYSDTRGHPRLRLRHARFSIGTEARDAWVRHMREALLAARIGSLDEHQMLTFFEASATDLVNTA